MHYKVNYNYVDEKNQLRNAAIIVEAKSVEEGKKTASDNIGKHYSLFRLTNIRPY